ncbi:TonB-dependent receptor [Methylotenera mobilis JLW8]|uniref:TonB-dependent receptor n=2 Tax=Methylotenera mobilis TaxID=359408 RepID=C6WTL3_METML|nr:TonB-dependent receptor [Methylotenera mobilis JLW8]
MHKCFYYLALIGVSPIALAQSDAEPWSDDLLSMPFEQLANMEVTSASKIASQMSAASSAVSIVTSKDIKDQGYRTLAEILASMRGLNITEDRAYSFLGGRGFGRPGDFTGRIMLLLDGNQVNNNIYNSAGLGYTGIIDVSLIERVEYVSGPGSAIYGNNAFFGIINIITKQGHDINGVQVIGEAASYGSKEFKVNYGKRLDNDAEVLLSASGFNSVGQNYYYADAVSSSSDGVARNLDDQSSHHFLGKVEYDGWSGELAYSNRKKDVPTAPYKVDFNTPYNYEDTSLQGSIRHDRQFSKYVQMSLRAYYGNYKYDGLSTYTTPWVEQSTGQWWGLNTQFIGTWFDNHRILLGVEYRDDFEQELSIRYQGMSGLNASNSEKTLSLYAQDEIKLNQQWMANIGARYDINRDSNDRTLGNISPRLALTYKPVESTVMKLSWSSAFRRANPFEKYYADEIYNSQRANPNLDPEKIQATELVLEHHPDKSTRVLSTFYHQSTEDYLRNETLPGSSDKQFQNTSGASTNGIEVEFEKHWSNDIRLRTSVAYQNAKADNGEPMINIPRQIGKMNLSTPLLSPNWRLAFELQAYSKRYTEDKIGGHYIDTGGYSLANLTISTNNLLPNTDLAFGIRNLLNRDYDHVAPKSNELQTTIRQNDRNYWLRVIYNFR